MGKGYISVVKHMFGIQRTPSSMPGTSNLRGPEEEGDLEDCGLMRSYRTTASLSRQY